MGIENNSAFAQSDPAAESTAAMYEIRVKGCMDEIFWKDWFGSLDFQIDPVQEETTLRGTVADQAELYGLLSRLRNKGLTLISVQQVTDRPKEGG